MRKIFIIFLLLINFLFSTSYGQEVDYCVNNFCKNKQTISTHFKSDNIISVDFKGYENAVLRLNQNQEEISALLSESNKRIFNPEYAFNKKQEKIRINIISFENQNSKSHNISSILEYEICTRAP